MRESSKSVASETGARVVIPAFHGVTNRVPHSVPSSARILLWVRWNHESLTTHSCCRSCCGHRVWVPQRRNPESDRRIADDRGLASARAGGGGQAGHRAPRTPARGRSGGGEWPGDLRRSARGACPVSGHWPGGQDRGPARPAREEGRLTGADRVA